VLSNSWLLDGAVDNYQMTVPAVMKVLYLLSQLHTRLDDATVQPDKFSVGIHTCEPCCGPNELASSLPLPNSGDSMVNQQ